jgi:tripartite-type tricarboxylate transporter receptor subunit TctC
VLSGSVQLTFENIGILLPLIKDGKLRALAVTSPLRTEQMPELPTMMEAGVPDYEVTSFFGLVAPAGTPGPTVHALNAAINQALKNDETRAIITRLGAVPTPGSPDQFGAFIAAQTRKWKSIGDAAGVRIE